MPRHHGTTFESRGVADYHGNAPTSATSNHALHESKSLFDGPVDYRQQNIPFQLRNGHGQANSQPHQQQLNSQQQGSLSHCPRPQQWRPPQIQHPGLQASYMQPTGNMAAPHALSKQQHLVAGSTATTLLPHCTVDIPLNEHQVIAITGVAKSMKELVLLALGAKDSGEECASRLEDALGSEQAAAGVVSFFSGEFEIQ